MNRAEPAEWVDRQLAALLEPALDLPVDTDRALRRLHLRQVEWQSRKRHRLWLMAVASMAMCAVVAIPPARLFVLAKLRGGEAGLYLHHAERKAAPDFVLPGAAGQPVQLSAYRGKVVLLNFWATWCDPCKREIPWFVEFQRTFERQGFAVIGVSLDESGWAAVRPYLARQPVNYPVVVGDSTVLNAFGGLETLPTTLILDRRGRVAATHVGLVSKDTYERDITAALAGPR